MKSICYALLQLLSGYKKSKADGKDMQDIILVILNYTFQKAKALK